MPCSGADAEPILSDDFGDLGHRARCFEAEIADDDVRFVDQDARALVQLASGIRGSTLE